MRASNAAPDGPVHVGDVSDLAAAGARAVLFGTSDHAPGSALPSLPAVTTTLDDLELILGDACGLQERVQRLASSAPQSEIVAAVEQTVREATGPVLLCYVGHGILGPADELYLATENCRSPESIVDAVPYSTIRNLLTEAPGGSVVILDCCYSGRAKAPGTNAGAAPPFIVTRPDGSYLLSSASWYDLSYAPEARRHTLFGGRLVELLSDGDPAGAPWLTLDGLYAALDRTFQDGPIRPWRQSEGTLNSLRLVRNRAYPSTPSPVDPPADVPCPFPGMEPFGATQAQHFFGREDLVRRLLDKVCDVGRPPETGATGPVILVGGSGVGKTSLLTAGLLAGLEHRRAQDHLQEALPWPPALVAAPGPHPLRALAETWSRATGRREEEVYQALSVGRLPEARTGHEPCRLLVVDQFEEVFTRCADADERARFISVLTSPEGTIRPPRVVLALRGDHYGDCLTHPGLARALEHGLFNVPPMDDDGLRAAVERPAEAAGLTLAAGLTDRLLHDLRHGDGGFARDAALPFLAHALRETWLRRSGATLTLAGYEATGGIWHAVTTTTDQFYDELDDIEREALRRLLFRLVHVTDDVVAVRRRVSVGSLLDGLSTAQRAAASSVRERLAATRLITVDQDHAQIAHEALLVAWPRLRAWIEEDREHLVRRQRLTDGAEEWVAAGRHADFLLTGIKLDAAQEVLGPERLPYHEREFVEASLAADRAVRERESRLNRRLTWRLRIALVGLCMALAATALAFWQSSEADQQRAEADRQQLVADQQRDIAVEQRLQGTVRALEAEAENVREQDPRLSLRLGLAAHRLRPSAQSRAVMFGTLAQTHYSGSSTDTAGGGLDPTVLSDNGRLEASASDGRIIVWDVSNAANRKQLAVLSECADPEHMAFGPNNGMLAAACDNGAVMLWSLADPALPRLTAELRIGGLQGRPASVAFSPRGGLLAAAGYGDFGDGPKSDRAVVLWRVSASGPPRRIAVKRGLFDHRGVLFSPDGRILVSSTGMVSYKEEPVDSGSLTQPSGASLWDVSTPERPRRVTRLDWTRDTMAFSPDGKLLATTDSADRLVLWDVSNPSQPRRRVAVAAHKDFLSAFAFAPSGDRLAVGSFDKSITVWDVREPAKPTKLITLHGHERMPEHLAFSRDGMSLTSVDSESVMRWRLTPRGRPQLLANLTHRAAVTAAVFTGNSSTLATAGYGQSVYLWNVKDPGRSARLASMDVGAFVQDLSVDADGNLLAAADRKGHITFWDISVPTRPRKLSVIDRGANGYVLNIGLNAAGTTLIARGAETLFSTYWNATWDVSDASHPGPMRMIESGAAEGETATPDEEWNVTVHAELHPDGNLGADTTEAGDVLLEDLGEPRHRHTAFRFSAPAQKLAMLGFSPDGRLALVSRGSTVQVWSLESLPALSADPVGPACELAGGGLGPDEWTKYAPGVPYQGSCSHDGGLAAGSG
nr:WD40 repeat domain-containing protein [Streptomyces sp. NBC_00995]